MNDLNFLGPQDALMTFLYCHPGSTWSVHDIANILRIDGYIISNVAELHTLLLDLRDKELIGITEDLMIYYLD